LVKKIGKNAQAIGAGISHLFNHNANSPWHISAEPLNNYNLEFHVNESWSKLKGEKVSQKLLIILAKETSKHKKAPAMQRLKSVLKNE